MHPITPCLWFNNQAEAAVNYYASVFKSARIGSTMRYDKESAAVSGQAEGAVMTMEFELNGQPFLALNGGPHFKLNEAVSFIVKCDTQAEIDHYWDKLTAGGDTSAQQCGWLKDRFGVSWQIVPVELPALLAGPGAGKVMQALLRMSKLDIAALRRAAADTGGPTG